MRLFIAIELPPTAKEALVGVQQRLRTDTRKSSLEIGWVTPDHMHLTLRFFAEVAPVQVDSLRESLAEVAATCTPFVMRLEGVGVFPEEGPPRVVWAGVGTGRTQTETLVQRLTESLAGRGWAAEPRPFHPHVTLGRIKRAGPRQAFISALQGCAVPEELDVTVDHLALIESQLSSHGPRYTTLYSTTPRTHT